MRVKTCVQTMFLAVGLAATACNANAAPLYFDTASSGTTWNESLQNWGTASGGGYDASTWVAGSDAYFEGTAGTVSVGTIGSVGSINFSSGSYVLSGGAITLTGSGGSVTAASGANLISSNIHGSVGMTKTGNGMVVLAGSNDFSGAIHIYAGTLGFTSANPVPSYGQINVYNGGTVAIYTGLDGSSAWTYDRIGNLVTNANLWSGSTLAIDTTYSNYTHDNHGSNHNSFRGSMALAKTGSGTLTLATANSYEGGTKIYTGTLVAPNTSVLPRYNYSTSNGGVSLYGGATLAVNVGGTGEWTVDDIGGFINYGDQYAGSWLALDTTNGNFTLNGTGANQVRGMVGLSKIGSGTLTLSDTSPQNYRGGTTIYGGTLKARTAAALPGYDQLTSVTDAQVANLAYRGVALYAGGTLAVNVGASDEWTVAQIGEFIDKGDQYAGSQLAIDTTDGDFTFDGSGSHQIRGAVGLTKLGNNTLTFSTAQNYRGATIVDGGTLALDYHGTASGGALSPSTAVTVNNGATLRIGSWNALGGFPYPFSTTPSNIPAVTVNAGGLITIVDGYNCGLNSLTLMGGTVTNVGSGEPEGWGTWNLYGDVTVGGGATSTMASANMTLDNQQSSAGVTFTVDSGSTLNVTGTFVATTQSSGLQGLTKAGAGTMTMSGANTYTGATTINAGVLNIQNSQALGDSAGGAVSINVYDASLQMQGGITVAGKTLNMHGVGANAMGALWNVSGDNAWTGAVNVSGNMKNRIRSDAGTLTIDGAVTLAEWNPDSAYGGSSVTDTQLAVIGDGNVTINGDISGGTWYADGASVGRRGSTTNGTLTLNGRNTYLGNTCVPGGTLVLAAGGSTELYVTDSMNSMIYGVTGSSGTLMLNGELLLNVAGVTGTTGIWTLVDAGTVNASYDSTTFSVALLGSFNPFLETDNVWTYDDSGKHWTFTEATGVLQLTAVPEPASIMLLGIGLTGLLAYAWRKRR